MMLIDDHLTRFLVGMSASDDDTWIADLKGCGTLDTVRKGDVDKKADKKVSKEQKAASSSKKGKDGEPGLGSKRKGANAVLGTFGGFSKFPHTHFPHSRNNALL